MPEQHEFVQKQDSYEKMKDGLVFHCTTSRGNQVDIHLTVCTPHIIRFRMCPDGELRDVKGLLDIKEEWPATAFDVSETPEAVSVDTGAVRFEAQRNPWKYVVYDKAGQVVLQENVRDLDAHTNYRSLPVWASRARMASSAAPMRPSTSSQERPSTASGKNSRGSTSLGRGSRGGTPTPMAQGPRKRTRTFPSL